MFNRLDAIQPIAPTRFGQTLDSDDNAHHPLLDGRAWPGKRGRRNDQRGGKRRSDERRRKERRLAERRDDDNDNGLLMVTERRLAERRALDRRDQERRHGERRLPNAPRLNLRGPTMRSPSRGRSRNSVIDDYA